MNTHRDDEHVPQIFRELVTARQDAFKKLEAEADQLVGERRSDITSGGGDPLLAEWEAYGITVREYPERSTDEALNIVRVSVGGSVTEGMGYCVFRGSRAEAKDLLRRALNALSKAP